VACCFKLRAVDHLAARSRPPAPRPVQLGRFPAPTGYQSLTRSRIATRSRLTSCLATGLYVALSTTAPVPSIQSALYQSKADEGLRLQLQSAADLSHRKVQHTHHLASAPFPLPSCSSLRHDSVPNAPPGCISGDSEGGTVCVWQPGLVNADTLSSSRGRTGEYANRDRKPHRQLRCGHDHRPGLPVRFIVALGWPARCLCANDPAPCPPHASSCHSGTCNSLNSGLSTSLRSTAASSATSAESSANSPSSHRPLLRCCCWLRTVWTPRDASTCAATA
jgi:hypothetical protein